MSSQLIAKLKQLLDYRTKDGERHPLTVPLIVLM